LTNENEARETLATVGRIFAMQGLLGLFGHVSVYDPKTKRVLLTPAMGSDKANFRAEEMVAADLDGRPLDGDGRPPVEWPIHTALHAARADALAVAHLHTPYATLFTIAKRAFRPVTLQGTIFSGGVPLYREAHLVTTPERGKRLAKVIGDKRAALLRAHGIVVAGKNVQEVLYAALVLEDDAKKSMQAASLGKLAYIEAKESRAFAAEIALERRSQRAWDFFCRLESRWDRQPGTGKIELFP
jgi:L-fuculose-phosphate aldolase